MGKYVKAVLASLMIAPTANAALINMSYFMTTDNGSKHYIEKPFWCYGSKDDPCMYTGTTWKVVKPSGKSVSNKVYFDCKDATWGMSTPTTWDIQTGSVSHEVFELACGKDQ